MKPQALPVRMLAELVHRRGDLYAYRSGPTTGAEGVATQRRLQGGRAPSYRAEAPVQLDVSLPVGRYRLSGRIDGLDLDSAPPLVEEFKTTRADPHQAHAHDGPVHWAQAKLYAAILAAEHPQVPQWRLRLLYCHPRKEQAAPFEQLETSTTLQAFLEETLRRFAARIGPMEAHRSARNAWLAERDFPYPDYRPHQRPAMRRCYRAVRDKETLLLEAPTGSGKTMTTLYAALKSLPRTGAERLMFLTSRGTGAQAAEAALDVLDAGAGRIRRITLAAKEKQCLVAGMPCAADACPYARGYFDKRDAALTALLDAPALTPALVRTVGKTHEVCPYELSLDAALWADVVIGDFNYVFDPLVRLQRFADGQAIDLLVDEAHQLSGRAAEMLSARLRRSTIKDALAKGPPAAIARDLRSMDRALSALRRSTVPADEAIIAAPAALTRATERFARNLQEGEAPLDQPASLQAAAFAAGRWLRGESWRRPGAFLHSLRRHGRDLEVRLHCLDASEHIRETLGRYRSSIRFSGTLSPLSLYNALHGLKEAPAERAGSPFAAGQLALLLIEDINTYFGFRDKSMGQLVDLVCGIIKSHPDGRYLAAFPSYEYLNAFLAAASTRLDAGTLHGQVPDMSDEARLRFLQGMAQSSVPAVAAVVLGGVFAESVDFSAVPISGVLVVGAGLPPPDLHRAEQEKYFAAQGVDGKEVAYLQPAMTRVLQVAGRLLRSPQDRGVICLIDPRFGRPAYQRFFPAHWRPQPVTAVRAPAAVANFWRKPMLALSP